MRPLLLLLRISARRERFRKNIFIFWIIPEVAVIVVIMIHFLSQRAFIAIFERLRRSKLRRSDAAQDVGTITGTDRTYPGCGAAGKSCGGNERGYHFLGNRVFDGLVCFRSAERCGS